MKIDKVTYNTSFVTGPYLQDKIGFEATLEKGDTPEKALSELKEIAEKWKQENVPAPETVSRLGEIQVAANRVWDAKTESEILNSKDIPELQSFAKFVNKNTQYLAAYNKRLKELGGKNGKKIALP